MDFAASHSAPAGVLNPSTASTAVLPAMRPPLESVVRSPSSGREITAQTPSAIFSRVPNGSRATVWPRDSAAQTRRAPAGITDAASARWQAQVTVFPRNVRRSNVMAAPFFPLSPEDGGKDYTSAPDSDR